MPMERIDSRIVVERKTHLRRQIYTEKALMERETIGRRRSLELECIGGGPSKTSLDFHRTRSESDRRCMLVEKATRLGHIFVSEE